MSSIWILIPWLSLNNSLVFMCNTWWKVYRSSTLSVLIHESSLCMINACMKAFCTSLVCNRLKLVLTKEVIINTSIGIVLLRSSNTYVPFLSKEGICLIILLTYASWTYFSVFSWWFSTKNRFSSSFTASCTTAFSIIAWCT